MSDSTAAALQAENDQLRAELQHVRANYEGLLGFLAGAIRTAEHQLERMSVLTGSAAPASVSGPGDPVDQ